MGIQPVPESYSLTLHLSRFFLIISFFELCLRQYYSYGNAAVMYLQVVRELGPASVTRVHGDEHRAGWVERQLCPLKQEGLQIPGNGLLYAEDLLGHHREHLHLCHTHTNIMSN